MPIKSCQKGNKSGFKWGDSGTCYTGPEAKKKAHKQGVAIEMSKKRRGEKSEFASQKENLLAKIQDVLFGKKRS